MREFVYVDDPEEALPFLVEIYAEPGKPDAMSKMALVAMRWGLAPSKLGWRPPRSYAVRHLPVPR